jgi:hypothetical protein
VTERPENATRGPSKRRIDGRSNKVRRRRFPVGSGHSDKRKGSLRVAVHRGRREGQTGLNVIDVQQGNVRRNRCIALRQNRYGASRDSFSDEGVPVVLRATPYDEQVSWRDAPRVVMHAETKHVRVAVHDRCESRKLACKVPKTEPRGRDGGLAHDAGSNTRRTLDPFAAGAPADGN